MSDRHRTIIDAAAIHANAAHLIRIAGVPLYAVVKADGYGHGAVTAARAALAAGATAVCVATLDEAVAVRDAIVGARVIVLSPIPPGREREVGGLELVVSTPAGVALARGRDDVRVHVKVDTGMGRWGLPLEEARELGDLLAAGGRLAGLASHLATSEEPDPTFTERQVERFAAVAATFPACPRHLANSGGALYHAATRFDAVRCGIALYGISPRDDPPAADGLRPALRLESAVVALRDLEPGDSSGYGRRLIARARQRIALVPVGYADGYPRALSGRADVIIRGRRMPIEATVSMDQLAVSVPADATVAIGDPVTLIGRDGGEEITLSELARRGGTVGYEIACCLRERAGRGWREVVGA